MSGKMCQKVNGFPVHSTTKSSDKLHKIHMQWFKVQYPKRIMYLSSSYRSEVPANIADKNVVFRKRRVLMIQLGLDLKSKIGYVQFRDHSIKM